LSGLETTRGLSLAQLARNNLLEYLQGYGQEGIDFLATEYIPGITLDIKLGGGPLNAKGFFLIARKSARVAP